MYERRSHLDCRVRPNALTTSLSLPQHADQHRPQNPILLAVDEQLGEGSEDDAAGSG